MCLVLNEESDGDTDSNKNTLCTYMVTKFSENLLGAPSQLGLVLHTQPHFL